MGDAVFWGSLLLTEGREAGRNRDEGATEQQTFVLNGRVVRYAHWR
jgi:hypothetical protein